MSQIEVSQISSVNGSNPIYFINGISGDGTGLKFGPEVLSFSPEPFSTEVGISTNITITFDQDLQFSTDSGTIELRSGSETGSIVESYTTGSSGNLSIVDNTLIINPSSNLQYGTTYFLTLPSVGIANTFGSLYRGNSKYNFTTEYEELNLIGGTHVFTRADGSSPTGYYKYHIFLGTGSLEFNSPSSSNPDFIVVAVAGGGSGGAGYNPNNTGGGGGGAGGVFVGTGSNYLPIPGPATYTVTVGAGGARVPSSGAPSPSNSGSNTFIWTTPTNKVIDAVGGGYGGGYPSSFDYSPGGTGGSGGGGAGQQSPDQPRFPATGYVSWSGGFSISEQGNPGGYGASGYTPTYGNFWVGGGGGGAGAVGGNATYPSYPGPGTWPTNPNSPIWNATSGDGGIGRAIPQFGSPALSGNTPLIPSDVLNEIGPTGRYGGGGGGGAPSTVPFARAGQGGVGGGGHGATVKWPPASYPQNGSPFPPETPNIYTAQDGYQYSGGGGGGGTAPNPSYLNGAGGSGIVMIRYSVPSL